VQSLLIVACMFSVPALLPLGQIRVLNDFRSWKVLFAVGCLLAATGIALFLIAGLSTKYALGLAVPLYQLLLFRLAYTWFNRKYGREPVNAATPWQRGFVPDRFFALFYTLLAWFSGFAIIATSAWGTAS
jgi:hypothetical protein